MLLLCTLLSFVSPSAFPNPKESSSPRAAQRGRAAAVAAVAPAMAATQDQTPPLLNNPSFVAHPQQHSVSGQTAFRSPSERQVSFVPPQNEKRDTTPGEPFSSPLAAAATSSTTTAPDSQAAYGQDAESKDDGNDLGEQYAERTGGPPSEETAIQVQKVKAEIGAILDFLAKKRADFEVEVDLETDDLPSLTQTLGYLTQVKKFVELIEDYTRTMSELIKIWESNLVHFPAKKPPSSSPSGNTTKTEAQEIEEARTKLTAAASKSYRADTFTREDLITRNIALHRCIADIACLLERDKENSDRLIGHINALTDLLTGESTTGTVKNLANILTEAKQKLAQIPTIPLSQSASGSFRGSRSPFNDSLRGSPLSPTDKMALIQQQQTDTLELYRIYFDEALSSAREFEPEYLAQLRSQLINLNHTASLEAERNAAQRSANLQGEPSLGTSPQNKDLKLPTDPQLREIITRRQKNSEECCGCVVQ